MFWSMRIVVVVLLTGNALANEKFWKAPPFCGFGNSGRTFWATALNRFVGMMFPGNGSRHCTPTTVRVVAGSKICPWSTVCPVQGFTSPVEGPSRLEKSPLLYAASGTVFVVIPPRFCRYCSHAKKKNVLSLPLYSFGIHTGPP